MNNKTKTKSAIFAIFALSFAWMFISPIMLGTVFNEHYSGMCDVELYVNIYAALYSEIGAVITYLLFVIGLTLGILGLNQIEKRKKTGIGKVVYDFACKNPVKVTAAAAIITCMFSSLEASKTYNYVPNVEENVVCVIGETITK